MIKLHQVSWTSFQDCFSSS